MTHDTTRAHAAHSHREPNYLGVILTLAVFTLLEVGVIYVPVSKILIGLSLVVLALTKAALVAMFFMHLKFEKWALALIAMTPLVLCGMLMFALLPDNDPEDRLAVPATAAEAPAAH